MPDQSQGSHSPFLQLPFELRTMIYREILAPATNTPIRNFIVPAEDIRIYRNVIRTPKEHLAILLTNKQISAEASDVLYELCSVKMQIAIYGHDRRGAVPQNASVDHPFRRLRNVEIEFDTWLYTHPLSSWWIVEATRSLAILCDEIVYQGASLKNLILKVPCLCKAEPKVLRARYKPSGESCIKVDDFERITEPLRRLKASHSIALQCSCDNRNEILPAFDRLAAEVRSGGTVQTASCEEMVWLGLRRKAEPCLGRSLKLRDLLSYGWSVVGALDTENEVDALALHWYFKSIVRCVDRMLMGLHEIDDVIDVIALAQLRLAADIEFRGYDDAMPKTKTWTFETVQLVAVNDVDVDGMTHKELMDALAALRLAGELM
ncbi:MAG: hypothetical protein Q9184_005628, partial [Pyrenodesmia sp. 2 TL-2023]